MRRSDESAIRGKLLYSISVALIAGAIAFMDWKRFFPISAHSDLKFQIVGEILEALALLGIFTLLFVFAEQRRSKGSQEVSGASRALAGTAFGVTSIVLNWREFFPNNQFKAAAGADTLTGALFMGLFFGLFAFSFPRNKGKPTKEEDKLVV